MLPCKKMNMYCILLKVILAFSLGDMNQVQQVEVAVGFSVGMSTDLVRQK